MCESGRTEPGRVPNLARVNVTRAVMAFSILVAIVGSYLLYSQTNLNRWVSVAILAAGLFVFIGLVIVIFAEGGRDDRIASARPTPAVEDEGPALQPDAPR